MSSSSDTDEFYDAEENILCHSSRKSRKSLKDENLGSNFKCDNEKKKVDANLDNSNEKHQGGNNNEQEFAEPPKASTVGGRKKFKELRQKLQTDDEDCQTGNVTPPNSQTSSVDGVFAGSSKTTHPFRVVEQDAISLQSLSSLGRIGRILNTTDTSSASDGSKKTPSVSALSTTSSLESGSSPSLKEGSKFSSSATLSTVTSQAEFANERSLPLQEPDVIASTKNSNVNVQQTSDSQDPPVAPPRRKKKNKQCASPLSLAKSASSTTFTSSELSSPASTIEQLTRELEHSLDSLPATKPKSDRSSQSDNESKSSTLQSKKSLDIKQAIKGQFVVKPQDNNSSKATKISATPTPSPHGTTARGSVGHYSLGPHRGSNDPETSSQRRKSAGDENMLKAGMRVKTQTDSGKHLSDLEILEQVTVLNLDTGERVPLSVAEDKLPQCINPLSLHIMRLTSEYVSSSSMEKEKESDEESVETKKSDPPTTEDSEEVGGMRKRTAKIKRFLGSTVKKTMHKAKTIAQEVSHARHKEDTIDIVDVVNPGEQSIKLKTSNSHKGPYEFEKVEHVQEIKDEHEGPIWCMKFSSCGRLLATAGQDRVLRIWIVKDAFPFFQDMRTKYNTEKVSPTPSQESLVSHHSTENANLAAFEAFNSQENTKTVFLSKPFCTYSGHTSDLLDVSWSKNYFILSSSMDKTVRLWHISRKECLCCFQHIDFVTAIVFHPRDDRYFLSGSLDGKLRLWNIPDKKVAVWTEVEGNPKLITAANFCRNGVFAMVGTYDGRWIIYHTEQLKYHTQISVKSSRGRNATGRKISGIEPMPGEDKILITSNDSRIRLYNFKELNICCKYKGYVNISSQIKASFSHDGKYIISGSENRDIYIWKTNHDYAKFSSVRRDRNDFWEAIRAHNAVVTCAIFAPNPEAIIKMIEERIKLNSEEEEETNKVEDPIVEQHTKGCGGYVLVSADFNGCIKVFVNKMKPKHSSLPVSAMA